jgi:hypothetical protein
VELFRRQFARPSIGEQLEDDLLSFGSSFIPARLIALTWTKASSPPSSGSMKPKLSIGLYHFTVPISMTIAFGCRHNSWCFATRNHHQASILGSASACTIEIAQNKSNPAEFQVFYMEMRRYVIKGSARKWHYGQRLHCAAQTGRAHAAPTSIAEALKKPLPMEAQGQFDRSLAQGFGPDRGIEIRAAKPRRGMPDASSMTCCIRLPLRPLPSARKATDLHAVGRPPKAATA